MAIKRHAKRYPTYTSPAVRGGLLSGRVRPLRETMYERLHIDQLEERRLMTVTPQDGIDRLVTVSTGGVSDSFDRSSAQQVAVDNDGDFVATWVREETIVNPVTGGLVSDQNIYARYYTDEVQRITLPGSAVGGRIQLTHGGDQVIQRAQVSEGLSVPFDFFTLPVNGSYTVGMDIDGDGAIGAPETAVIPLNNPAAAQANVRALGGPLSEAMVQFAGPTNMYFAYPAAEAGGRRLSIVSNQGLQGGFLPAATLTTIQEPVLLADPLVAGNGIRFIESATPAQSAADTARLIQSAFDALGATLVARSESLSYDDPSLPLSFLVKEAETEVVGRYNAATDTYEFDVWFKNDSGKRDFPQLGVTLTDGAGDPVDVVDIETLKEPGPAFRVNEAESFDPVTGQYLGTVQSVPVVAMDADGDFAIAWQSQVSDATTFGSTSDIFARRFNSAGQALGGQFRVNSFTANPQVNPSISMDDAGNFVIGWVTTGQFSSFFNNVIGRRFDLNGQPLGSDFTVETELAQTDDEVNVAVSHDGFIFFTWVNAINGINVMGKAYDPNGSAIITTGAFDPTNTEMVIERLQAPLVVAVPTATWDDNNHVYVSWTSSLDAESAFMLGTYNNGANSAGVFARLYEMTFDAANNNTPQMNESLPTYRVNSEGFDPGAQPFWGGDQHSSQVVSDSDGDFTVIYQGRGKDGVIADADSQIRTALLPTYQQNVFGEIQDLTIFQGAATPTGTFIVKFGDLVVEQPYALAEVQTIQLFPAADPATGNYVVTMGKAAGGATAITDNVGFLDSIKTFLATVTPGGAVVVAGANDKTDINGDGILDFEVKVTFDGKSRLTDWDQVKIGLPPGDAGGNFTTKSTTDAESVVGVIENLVLGQLKYGDVSVTVPVDDLTKLPDLDGDGVADVPIRLEWLLSARGIDQPAVEVFRTQDDDGAFINAQEEQLLTIFPEDDPLTGQYMLRFGGNVVRPFTYTTPEALVDQVRITLNTLTPGGVVVGLAPTSGTDLNGDGVPEIQLKIRFAGASRNVDQPLVEFLPAVGDDGLPLPDAVQASAVTLELVKGAVTADLAKTANVRSETIETRKGSVNEAPIRSAKAQLENNASGIRGGAADVMSAAYDADQIKFPSALAKTSETVLNAGRTGQNEQVIMAFRNEHPDPAASFRDITGAFEITLPNNTTVSVTWPANTDTQFLKTLTTSIDDAIEGTGLFGVNYPEDDFPGPVTVRVIPAAEIAARTATAYDLIPAMGIGNFDPVRDIYIEVTFIGAVHDMLIGVGFGNVGDLLSGPSPNFAGDDVDQLAASSSIATERPGDSGNLHSNSSIAMEPDGDYVVVWNDSTDLFNAPLLQFEFPLLNSIIAPSINFQRYNEDTDTAGPKLTEFMLPNGDRLPAGGQLTQPIDFLVASFDEEMMTTGPSAITDPRNWALLKDGTSITGGIRSIEYGMNKAADLGLGPRSNKFEVILQFDGNGASSGVAALPDGNYEVVAKTSLRDRSGNPLGRRGFFPNGQVASRQFSVATLGGGEVIVNQTPAGAQATQAESPKQVAGDGDGDFVAVWTSASGPQVGVYASVYHSRERGEPAELVSEIQVTADPNASYASVARDGDGDFVVTWSSLNQANPDDEWDVFARMYDARGNAKGESFRVNSYTESLQRYSTVAMDVDGDFVITWQSLDQDEGGYGVYAQRYNPAGEAIGGVHETQQLTFNGSPRSGSFRLIFGGEITAEISLAQSSLATAANIEAALEALAGIGDVEVTAATPSDFRIEFVDTFDDLPQILPYVFTFEPEGAYLTVSTIANGAPGEFQVADTTDGDQTLPDIAMEANGEFVITWTSTGQDGDPLFNANIYARRFSANEVVSPPESRGTTSARDAIIDTTFNDVQPRIVTVDLPANHVVPAGTGFDGVAQLIVHMAAGDALCSGSLLMTGRHILTAAHCVTDAFGNLSATGVDVVFTFPGGQVTIPSSQIIVHPGWTGDLFNGNDIAIIELSAVAPSQLERYDIYRNSDEVSKQHFKYGYGLTGQGPTGSVPGTTGTKRFGANQYDAGGELLNGAVLPPGTVTPGTQLIFDFDDGTAARDFFGQTFGIVNLGYGANEINSASGDSGGPTFINGLIAGITSYGVSTATDVDQITNSSFGEISGDTRVSTYADWIDRVLGGGAAAAPLGPEFLVNVTTADNQHQSSVSMDSDGDFVIAWTSYGNDAGGNGYGGGVGGEEGVFARRFNNAGAPASGEFVVSTYVDGNQQAPRVAMDADGDFVVAWESFRDVDPGTLQPTSYGIYIQRYVRNGLVGASTFFGPNGEVGAETAMNSTKPGDQRFPSVSMDNEGDIVVLWSGPGARSGQEDADGGVYFRRLEAAEDTAGPQVTKVYATIDGEYEPVFENAIVTPLALPETNEFVVLFSEDVLADGIGGFNSVTNPLNWELSRNGRVIANAVVSVQYGLSQRAVLGGPESDAYEAIVQIDADPQKVGLQPLPGGLYTLTLRDRVEDQAENSLDGDYDGIPGGSFVRTFSVGTGNVVGGEPPDPPGDPLDPTDPEGPGPDQPINTVTAQNQTEPVVASNAAGDYVVAWTSYATDPLGNIIVRMFNNLGQPVTPEIQVNDYGTGTQNSPSVSMDELGGFVVVWAGEGQQDQQGIYARRYDATGTAIGSQFIINSYRTSVQSQPSVAMDNDGDFVVAWTSFGQDGDRDGVVARMFDRFGEAVGNDFVVTTRTTDRQEKADVAIDADGDFVVVWNSYGQDGSSWGVYGQRFDAGGNRQGGEFRANSTTQDRQHEASVGMDDAGNFTVAWQSFSSGPGEYDVYGQRFAASGNTLGGEFRVNQTTTLWQHEPDVTMSGDGDIAFTWRSLSQDGDSGGIYARLYAAGGGDYVSTTTGQALGEFRVNVTTDGNQAQPSISADVDGDLAVVWTGPDAGSSTTNIFRRLIGLNDPAPSTVGANSGGRNEPGGGGGGGGGGNQNTWRNPAQPLDVNADGQITALDVLLVVNWLNTNGAGQLGAAPSPSSPGFVYIDVNGDNFVTAVDALQVVNHLNSLSQSLQANASAARSLAVEQVASVDVRLSAVGFSVDSSEVETVVEDEGETLEGLFSAVAQVRAASVIVPGSVSESNSQDESSDSFWTTLGMLEEDEDELAWV